jgi:NO-binding membrane sensor protein with MHYT domain
MRALLLPHRHGGLLVASAAALVISTILYGLGVWATHAIEMRRPNR